MMTTAMESIIPTAEDLFLIVKEANKPVEKHVSFDTNVIVHDSESDDSETPSRWYTKQEISALQREVHSASTAIRRGQYKDDDDLRGLEPYYDLMRAAHRKRVVSHVLLAQNTLKPSKLAKFSHDCTTWHKKIALVHALEDYCYVHDPSLSNGIPSIPDAPPAIAKLPTLKRQLSSSSSSSQAYDKRFRKLTRKLTAEWVGAQKNCTYTK